VAGGVGCRATLSLLDSQRQIEQVILSGFGLVGGQLECHHGGDSGEGGAEGEDVVLHGQVLARLAGHFHLDHLQLRCEWSIYRLCSVSPSLWVACDPSLMKESLFPSKYTCETLMLIRYTRRRGPADA